MCFDIFSSVTTDICICTNLTPYVNWQGIGVLYRLGLLMNEWLQKGAFVRYCFIQMWKKRGMHNLVGDKTIFVICSYIVNWVYRLALAYSLKESHTVKPWRAYCGYRHTPLDHNEMLNDTTLNKSPIQSAPLYTHWAYGSTAFLQYYCEEQGCQNLLANYPNVLFKNPNILPHKNPEIS